jgi:ParB-like chromosome segregation protein Spo0J
MTLTTHHTPISDLRPHPRNPRNGDTDAIAESLTISGQYRPIVITRDNVILAGNHTYAAAMELGWTHIDTVTIDTDHDTPEALRIMVADNRTADRGNYDHGLLLDLLDTLDTTVGLTGTGYSPDDITNLLVTGNGGWTATPDTPPPDTITIDVDCPDCPRCGYRFTEEETDD